MLATPLKLVLCSQTRLSPRAVHAGSPEHDARSLAAAADTEPRRTRTCYTRGGGQHGINEHLSLKDLAAMIHLIGLQRSLGGGPVPKRDREQNSGNPPGSQAGHRVGSRQVRLNRQLQHRHRIQVESVLLDFRR